MTLEVGGAKFGWILFYSAEATVLIFGAIRDEDNRSINNSFLIGIELIIRNWSQLTEHFLH